MRSSILFVVVLAGLSVCPPAAASPPHHRHAKTATPVGDPVATYIKQAYAYMDSGWPRKDVRIMTQYVAQNATIHVNTIGTVEKYGIQSYYYDLLRHFPSDVQIDVVPTLNSFEKTATGYTVNRRQDIAFSGTASGYIMISSEDDWAQTSSGWQVTHQLMIVQHYQSN